MNQAYLATLLLICISSHCMAQNRRPLESPEENSWDWALQLEKQEKQLTHFFNLNGILVCHHYPPEKPVEPRFPLKDFYLHPVIVAELEIDDSESGAIRRALSKYETDRVKLIPQNVDPRKLDSETKAELIKEIGVLRLETENKIRSLIGKKKHDRLRQIQLRFLIHNRGFWQCMFSSTVQSEFEISVEGDRSRVQEQRSIAMRLLHKERQLRNLAVEKWLEDLDDDQVEMFRRAWHEFTSSVLGCGLRQLELQLDPNIKKVSVQANDIFDFRKGWPTCDYDASGSLLTMKSKIAKEDKHPDLSRLRIMLSSFTSPHFRRDIEMSEEQYDRALAIRKEFLEHKRQINHEFGRQNGLQPQKLGNGEQANIIYPIQDQKMVDEFYQLVDQDAEKYCEQLMGVLLPHQRDLLKAVNRNIQVRFHGPLADLLWGELGQRLELTEEQKKQLRKKAKSTREWIRIESRKAYEKAMEDLIALAPFEDQKKIKSILGKTPEDWSPNLYIFSIALLSESK